MTKDIVTKAREAGNFETLLAALDAADLTESLQGEGPFTLFAPTDNAFDKLGQGVIKELLADTDTLADILKYHVSPSIVLAGELKDGVALPTLLDGSTIDVSVYGFWFFQFSTLNESTHISFSNILTSNGVIHVVMSPHRSQHLRKSLKPTQPLSTVDTLGGDGPFTVFAPNDSAFAELGDETIAALLADAENLLAPILTYHVAGAKVTKGDLESGAIETLNGAPVVANVEFFRTKINGARVTYFDLKGSNGVVHIINEVLLPPDGNCLEVAAANGLTQFVSAVQSAGLEGAITDPAARLTIFAPTNKAFEALTDDLDQATLATVLSYHVVPAVATGADLSDGEELPTLLANNVIDVEFKHFLFILTSVYLNEQAEIVDTNLLFSNGIFHQIDEVLSLP